MCFDDARDEKYAETRCYDDRVFFFRFFFRWWGSHNESDSN